ncbi:MAG: sensor histidine kinase [Bacteroidota bacterium]
MKRISDKELLEELQRRFDENKQSMKELQAVNKKLEESEALKSHFISNITNEIINPFTSILALSKSILSVKKEDWKKVISMVALIHSEAFNLDFQLRNIFMAAKIEAGELNPEVMDVDIVKLIENTMDSFRIEANKKKVQIMFSHNVPENEGEVNTFKTDPEKLRIILTNLLSNAVKFSFEDSNIEVSVNNADGILELTVKDYGCGLSNKNQQIIYDRFKRLDSGINSLNRGHGLGLSISKALIDLLNGKIHVSSQINKGTTFTVSLTEFETISQGFSSSGDEFMFDDSDIF